MIKKVKNNDIIMHTWCGQDIIAGETYTLGFNEESKWIKDVGIIEAVTNGLASLINKYDEIIPLNTALARLNNSFNSSFALDKNGSDQTIGNDNWTTITANRVIWDLNEDYDTETDTFTVPHDGIYLLDGEFKVQNALNLTYIEVALFKKGDPDDYWFILNKQRVEALQTEVQIPIICMFDFYEGEQYQVKIKLHGLLPSAKIDGDDDYTAWGLNFERQLY